MNVERQISKSDHDHDDKSVHDCFDNDEFQENYTISCSSNRPESILTMSDEVYEHASIIH